MQIYYSPNYSIALHPSLIVSVIISAAYIFYDFKKNKEEDFKFLLIGVIFFTPISFCLIYPILNFIFQDNKLQALEYELKTGILALRIASVFLIFNSITVIFKRKALHPKVEINDLVRISKSESKDTNALNDIFFYNPLFIFKVLQLHGF